MKENIITKNPNEEYIATFFSSRRSISKYIAIGKAIKVIKTE